MQKNYTGSQILAFMAAVQILSIPQLLNSPEAHHAATVMLLTYELVLCLLLASQARPSAKSRSIFLRLFSPAFSRGFGLQPTLQPF